MGEHACILDVQLNYIYMVNSGSISADVAPDGSRPLKVSCVNYHPRSSLNNISHCLCRRVFRIHEDLIEKCTEELKRESGESQPGAMAFVIIP